LEAIASLNSDKSKHHAFQQNQPKLGDDNNLDYLQSCATHYRWRLDAITHAEQLLNTSIRLFSWLANAHAEPSHFGALTYTHSQSSALKHKTHSEKLLGMIHSDLEKVRKLEADFSSKWEALHAQITKEREEKRIAEEEEAERKREEREKLLRQLEQEDEEKQRAFEEMHAALSSDKHQKIKRSRKSRGHEEAMVVEDDQEQQPQENESNSESESDNEKDGVKHKRLVGAEDDNEDEDDNDLFGSAGVDGDVNKAEPPQKRLRKVVSDDEDDDDMENDDDHADKDGEDKNGEE